MSEVVAPCRRTSGVATAARRPFFCRCHHRRRSSTRGRCCRTRYSSWAARLARPSRWGPQLAHEKQRNLQRLYLSEQTDESVPNTLVIVNCEVVKPLVAFAENITKFDEEEWSPYVKKYKTIIHPGEVNRIRELPQNRNIVATHTDSPNVYIWDVEAQPNRHPMSGATASYPDLILTGHRENADFALAMCPSEPFVLSGGKDKCVVLWSIQDSTTTLAHSVTPPPSSSSKQTGKTSIKGPTIGPRGVYQGHSHTVEDVQFCPSSPHEFCSVGNDSCLILWDARVGTSPVVKVEKAHYADVHCVDWNPYDPNLIITGSADYSVRLFDRRNLIRRDVGSPLFKFKGHEAAVLCVQWCPDKTSVFGSAGEDNFVNLWDIEKADKKIANAGGPGNHPSGLFFKHTGHRDRVTDFHWNPCDPWTIASVSQDGANFGGGGTLQIWRITDLLYLPEEEALALLQSAKEHPANCKPPPLAEN